jgi:hypothetical protein
MTTLQAGGPVEIAGAAYRDALERVARRRPFVRRWRARELLRKRNEGAATTEELIELRALKAVAPVRRGL